MGERMATGRQKAAGHNQPNNEQLARLSQTVNSTLAGVRMLGHGGRAPPVPRSKAEVYLAQGAVRCKKLHCQPSRVVVVVDPYFATGKLTSSWPLEQGTSVSVPWVLVMLKLHHRDISLCAHPLESRISTNTDNH